MHRSRKLLRKIAVLGGTAALGVAGLAATATPASATTVVHQRVRVVNAGIGFANSGGNHVVGTTTPGPTSTGTAVVHTGSAVGIGNLSYTRVNGHVWPF